MSAVATAVVGSAVIGGYASYKAGEAQKDAAKKGIKAEQAMSAENIAFQKEMAEQQRADFEPWRNAGTSALKQLQAGIESGEFDAEKFDPSQINLQSDPGYQFRMDEGIKALDNSAAARGRLLSGAQQKGVNAYAQNVASQEYGNAYARYADQYAKNNDAKARKYNMLSGLSQQGQASAAQQAGATSQLASTSGNIMAQSGQAQNLAYQNMGAARAGAYQGQAQAINQAGQNWLMYDAMKG